MLRISKDGQARPVKQIRIVRGGNKALVRRIRYFDGTALKVTYLGSPALAVTITPNYVSQYSNSTTITAPVTANISGGRAPYTYNWTATNGATCSPVNAATTQLRGAGFRNSAPIKEGVVSVTVTDADGQTASTDAAYYFEYISFD